MKKIILVALVAILIVLFTENVEGIDEATEASYNDVFISSAVIPPIHVENPSKSQIKAYTRTLVPEWEWNCLEILWNKESNWNPNAQNKTSTAYGIAQFLNSTWAGTGIEKTSDPYLQVDAGMIYIRDRFGDSCEALRFHQVHNYY